MSDLFEDVDLLENFPLRVVIFHIALIYGLYGDILSSKLMNAQSDFPKCPFSNQLNKLVVIEGSGRHLIILLDICSDELDYLIPFI